jgi:hypothetical protein
MKRFGWILLLLAVSTPTWAASSVTVDQMKQKLISLHQSYKEDAEIATWLKEVTLSEQLTQSEEKSLEQFAPGPLASEQLNILEGRSAFLAPPASDVPTAPAPDAAAQKAILAKASDYVAKTYAQNPHLVVSKITSRYQDDLQNMSSTPGLWVGSTNTFTQLWETRTEPVESDRGIEKPAASKGKTKWGQNGQVSEGEPGPVLQNVVVDASSSGTPGWLRWERIAGRQIAVFTFAVDKKKSHFDVLYCCFPKTDTEGNIATPHGTGGVSGALGDIQSNTTWRPFKKVVGYHGQLFIDPETGAIVRAITFAELKPDDFVHVEMRRVDYSPVVVEGKEYTLPAYSYTVTEIVPNADNSSSVYSVRHILFNSRYQNYRQAGSSQK